MSSRTPPRARVASVLEDSPAPLRVRGTSLCVRSGCPGRARPLSAALAGNKEGEDEAGEQEHRARCRYDADAEVSPVERRAGGDDGGRIRK